LFHKSQKSLTVAGPRFGNLSGKRLIGT